MLSRWASVALYQAPDFESLVHLDLLSRERVAGLDNAWNFIIDTRNFLHRLARDKTDTLTFELQALLAESLGYRDNGHLSRVERFMREYYTHVYLTKSTLDYFLSRTERGLITPRIWKMTQRPRRVEKGLTILRGRIELGSRAELREKPLLMMRAFEVSAQSGLPISQRSLELIRTSLDLVDENFQRDPAVLASFLRGLTAIPPKSARMPQDLDAMQILDLLEAYIPELAGVRAMVQHDAYHVYTVDIHLVAHPVGDSRRWPPGSWARGSGTPTRTVFTAAFSRK